MVMISCKHYQKLVTKWLYTPRTAMASDFFIRKYTSIRKHFFRNYSKQVTQLQFSDLQMNKAVTSQRFGGIFIEIE